MKQNQADKKSFHWKQGIWVVVWMIGLGILGGCNKQASLEDRTYVESLHVTPVEDAYQYQCILAYVNQDSMDQLKAGVSGTDQSQEGSDSSEDKQGMEGAVMMAGEGHSSDDGNEYTAVADDIASFNQDFYRLTGSQLDYSHLEGIYLDHALYQPTLAEDVLEDIWDETQVVLSTPIYQEGVEIGDQKDEKLGDWLKEGME